MSSTPPTVPPQLAAALKAEGARFAAEEAHRASKEQLPPSPGAAEPGAPDAPPIDAAATAALLVLLWDFAIASLVSQKLKLTDAEQALVTVKAEPVVRQYLPPELFLGSVGALGATLVGLYTVKYFAPDEVPPPSTETVDGSATPTPPPTPPGAPGVPS